MKQQYRYASDRPLIYLCRALSLCEKVLATTHKECLAAVWAVLLLLQYLHGSQFTDRTDYNAPKRLLKRSDASGKWAQRHIQLLEFKYDIGHPERIKRQAMDAVSSLLTDRADETKPKNGVLVLNINLETVWTV